MPDKKPEIHKLSFYYRLHGVTHGSGCVDLRLAAEEPPKKKTADGCYGQMTVVATGLALREIEPGTLFKVTLEPVEE